MEVDVLGSYYVGRCCAVGRSWVEDSLEVHTNVCTLFF